MASLKPGNATLIVPPSSLSFGADSVNGTCLAGGNVTVQLWGANGLFVDMGRTVADVDGSGRSPRWR